MIGLRVVHCIRKLRPSSAAGSCLALARWLRHHDHDGLILTTGGSLTDGAREEGHDVLEYEEPSPGRLGREKKKIINHLREWEADLIHVHSLDGVPAAIALAEKLDLPIIVSVHSAHAAKDAEVLNHQAVRLVLTPTESLRAHCCSRLHLNPDQVALLPYGVDATRFRAQPMANANPLTIGMVGNFDDDGAGFTELLAALAVLRDEDISFKARLLGRGEGLEALRREAEAAGLQQQVIVAEAGHQLAPAFGDLSIFVYPVHRDHNIMCLAKAMAAACAVVASAVGGVSEMISDGHNGVLVPAGDRAALTAALRGLLTDSAKVIELGTDARATIEQDNDLNLVGRAADELYRSTLRGGHAVRTSTEVVNTWRRVSAQALEKEVAEGDSLQADS